MDIQRGMRGKLFERFDRDMPLEIVMNTVGEAEYDYCCFGVDENEKLTDDRYMIFYNQTGSPSNEISYRRDGNGAYFTVFPDKLPDTVRRLVFTVSIDGEGNMGQISEFSVSIGQAGAEPLVLTLSGTDFSEERAIISIEIYMKGEWRYSAIAQGFNGGLSDLLEAYGGEEMSDEDYPADEPIESEEPAPEQELTPEPVPLEKPTAVQEPAPEPVPLEKPAADEAPKVSLIKLGNTPINLKKNERVELRKPDKKPLNKFTVGLGWDPAKAGASIDCDSSVFVCKNGKLVSKDDIISFYNKKHSTGGVIHTGDNLTGQGSGDDEKILIDLDKLKDYDRVVIVVNIFLSRLTRQHFGKIKNCYMRICDSRNKEMCRFTLSDNSEYNKMSAMIFGEFLRENGTWIFNPIGMGTKDHSIEKLAKRFKK